MYGKEEVKALKREEPKTKTRSTGRTDAGRYDEILFERLRNLRKKTADEHQVPHTSYFQTRPFTKCADFIL